MAVIPPSNLPGLSVPWGRRLASSNVETEKGIRNLGETVNGGNRSLAAQAAVQGRNIETLQTAADALQATVLETSYRNTAVQTIPSLTVARTTAATNTSYSYSSTTSATFDSPDGNERNGVLFISFDGQNSHPAITFGTLFLSAVLSGDNTNLFSGVYNNPSAASTPPGWTDAGFVSGGFRASSLGLTIRATGYVTRYSGAATTLTIGAQNIRMVVIWGGK